MGEINWGPHKCPVCGEYTFPCRDSYDICDVCDWEDNWYQEEYPDEGGLDNLYSVNRAKKHFQKYGTTEPFDMWEACERMKSGWSKKLKNIDQVPDVCKKYVEFLNHN